MKTRKQLYQTPGYWTEKIENELFRKLHEYMDREGLNRTQLAERLGFHKSYITQMLNGDLNFSVKKLTQLALKIGVVPELNLKSVKEYTRQEEARLSNYNYEDDITFKHHPTVNYWPDSFGGDSPSFTTTIKNKSNTIVGSTEYV